MTNLAATAVRPSRATTSPDTVRGIAFGAGAGALWGLVFLAPALIGDFTPLQLTVGRYLAYGLIALILVATHWRTLRPLLGRREWGALLWLALAGNIAYYFLLASAVQLGGVAMTSLVIGFLPVAVTIIGSRDTAAVPLARLAPSLLLCAAAACCIGWEVLAPRDVAGTPKSLAGLLCAIGALAAWTCYAVGNRVWLTRLSGVSAHQWNLLTGVVTGAQALLLVPLAFVGSGMDHDIGAWGQFAGVSVGVAILASIIGNGLWNRMSRLLPLTLVGQMILFETLFALIYGLAWEARLPTLLESLAFAFVVASVTTCLAAHRRPEPRTVGEA